MNGRMNLNEAKIAVEEMLMSNKDDRKHLKELYVGIIEDIFNDVFEEDKDARNED